MRASKIFMPTMREVPGEVEAVSHQLMLRAGLMRKLTSGVYNYLPLGVRVIRKIEKLAREKMHKMGVQEVMCASLLPAEIFKESGRAASFGQELLKLTDRNAREFYLAPDYKEVITDFIKGQVKSYKNLPIEFYQIKTRYSDEKKTRFGIIGSRELMIKDAFSFCSTWEHLNENSSKMEDAYSCIFDSCNIEYLKVKTDLASDTSTSMHFIVESEVGEEEIICCSECDYKAKLKTAVTKKFNYKNDEGLMEIKKVETPNARTIEDLEDFFKTTADRFVKTLIYKVGKRVVGVMVRGDRQVNDSKIIKHLNTISLELADEETVSKASGAEVGFAGPVNIKVDELLVDYEVVNVKNMIVGANETEYHHVNVNYGRDFTGTIGDFRYAEKGDLCPVCNAPTKINAGINIGHISSVGTNYSEVLGVTFIDENGENKPVIMGCSSITINKVLAAVIEQNHDDKGIVWPKSIAPYQVIIVLVSLKDEAQVKVAQDIYNHLTADGVEVLLDDRDERAGVKFNDADLIGIPIRITVGKKVKDDVVEFKLRGDQEVRELNIQDIDEEVSKALLKI
jgi:prolyl-tRNA synthetase